MSKSYGKYKSVGNATGSNTSFYKERRRNSRNKNKQIIRNMMANYNPEDFDEIYEEYKSPKKDHWREPTDGTNKIVPGDDKFEDYTGVYSYEGKYVKK